MHACTFKGCTLAFKCTLHRVWMKWALHLGTVLAGWMELSLAMNAPHGKNKTHLTSGAKELYSYIIAIMHDDITSWQIRNTWIVVPRTHALQARVYNYRVILLKGCMFPCVYIAMIALSMYVHVRNETDLEDDHITGCEMLHMEKKHTHNIWSIGTQRCSWREKWSRSTVN